MPKIKYQLRTMNQAMLISSKANGINRSHLIAAVSVFVSFQILAVDPAKDIGAATIIFSDASLFTIR